MIIKEAQLQFHGMVEYDFIRWRGFWCFMIPYSFEKMTDLHYSLQKIRNPVYLFQGIVLRRGAKGTGMKSIELALSMCDVVDIYGFTVDPGYTEWYVLLFLIFSLVTSALLVTKHIHIWNTQFKFSLCNSIPMLKDCDLSGIFNRFQLLYPFLTFPCHFIHLKTIKSYLCVVITNFVF